MKGVVAGIMGLAGPALLVLALSRAGAQREELVARPDAQPATVTVVVSPATTASRAGAPPAPPAFETLVLSQVAEQEAPQPRARERVSRWSRRNVYPGPIPTPEEWEPPAGPIRIGIQVGHWRADEAPRELSGLRRGGTSWRNTPEWAVNFEIAERTVDMLEREGYVVDLLPAVVPPSYRAHLFIAIHSDGSNDPSANGFRVAAPSRDATGRASQMVRLLERSYGEATGITRLPTVTRRMRNYYAFNFRRYQHALHPMTIGVILETGFLTSERDRRVIMDAPERAARGIVEAVKAFSVTQLPQERRGG